MPEARSIDIATVDASVFRPYLGQSFGIQTGDGPVRLTLKDVTEYPDHSGGERRCPFGLVFHSAEALLSQGTYTLTHAELPSLELFVSPFEGGEGWCTLEAIFN